MSVSTETDKEMSNAYIDESFGAKNSFLTCKQILIGSQTFFDTNQRLN